ncbi:unnamed protein product [Peronospora farinosa]|uniref:histone acetyltransferase n=1 Tax=Peronospora farinosa TaxID=134698 RepID=A0AAV0UNA3_9STRA|nr:unnamed protein product [Peronospora farinosa]CAI5736984.1 unnamed protein product [Peronospora farinosa]
MSEATDTEAPHVVTSTTTDEFVGDSQASSQHTEESVKNSQDSEVNEAKQEENDAQMSVNDATEKGDVEMTETTNEDMTKLSQEEAEEDEETLSKDVDMAPEQIREMSPDAIECDVEMAVDDETTQGAKEKSDDTADLSVDVDAVSETNGSVAPKPASIIAEEETSVKITTDDTEFAVDAESSQQSDTEMLDNGKPLGLEREESVQPPASESCNGVDEVAELMEPVAKKQKVDETVAQVTEKIISVYEATDRSDNASPSAIISRDDMAKMEEDSGRLKFDVITNDGADEHMIQLTTLKNIFAKQLPKMPKEYIVRLVFDKNHRSMLILKNGTHVIGGICYRPFEKSGFAEIAFCAINASDQVKGYGTRLMNHLKEYVKTKNITHFLTYADNYAIGYFKKQGFTKSVSMARPNWYGYIKDYDGGTLMECTIHTQINYLRITSMIHKQRKAIQDKIQERSRAKTVYSGLTNFAEGRLMDIYMVPGVKEAGWSQAVIRNNRIGTRDQGSLKSQLLQLLKAVSNHRSAWPFHEPVDTTVVVDYLDHIKEPVDLQLISKRIDDGNYISKASFKTDLDKMCENCMIYNTPDTNYYKAAMDLREFIQSRIQLRDQK